MDPLGLDPIHRWAQSENRDPTGSFEVIICGEYQAQNSRI